MLLSPAERRRPDKALEEMRKSGVVVDGMVFARLVALACSVSIVLFVVYAESFVNAVAKQRYGRGFTAYAIFAAILCSTPSSGSLSALCNDLQVQSRLVGMGATCGTI